MPRLPHRRGHASQQRVTGENQVPVLVIRDRHGATTDFKLKNWMMRFHGVATKYLNNYLGWRRGIE